MLVLVVNRLVGGGERDSRANGMSRDVDIGDDGVVGSSSMQNAGG